MLAGQCLCGAVRYSVRGAIQYAGYCHCVRCRAATGSAFSAFAGVEEEQLRVTDGEESIARFERNPDNLVSRCRRCGSALFALVREGRFYHIQMGTLLDDPGVRPTMHIFVGSKAPWHDITDSLPRYEGLPP